MYQKNRGFASSCITWIAGFICHSELLQAVNKLWHSHAYHKLKFPLLLAPQGLLARWCDVCCMRCIIGWNENVCIQTSMFQQRVRTEHLTHLWSVPSICQLLQSLREALKGPCCMFKRNFAKGEGGWKPFPNGLWLFFGEYKPILRSSYLTDIY